ncbi:MAG TPA: ferric iron uptake transcriptional regulator [Methylococcaceae bacterium]|nr:ferric iron uptake transcriptional regulator [Methylococcaceae bacterium]HIN67940.1 ferric iron uptake transcriptional regulator [Methylococcales bacterium]HIA44976.1 ferric iron uptake transcriptional regulator [Methylococcaceae bacterium]HIB61765.1 ferric iron uptake transcriptional regulator [Methylococcaceae bacterium]HIO12468.1 ferric iron uptake transcriptional regulator [Methylococcales bacterium]
MDTRELRSLGLKATLPRIKILEILEQQTEFSNHLTAEQIYKILIKGNEDIGLATIYRVLTQFESSGIVKRHHFEGGNSVFELDDGEHHDHILCVKCGQIAEFNDDLIEQRQKEISLALGYTLTDHSLYLYGYCAACR